MTPKEYMKFDLPLAAGAVRLAVLRLTDAESDNLATAVGEATQRVLQAVPQGATSLKSNFGPIVGPAMQPLGLFLFMPGSVDS